nr:uncharacterized protein LOC132776684 isoform X2 [Anolis sagrei ordinatus]
MPREVKGSPSCLARTRLNLPAGLLASPFASFLPRLLLLFPRLGLYPSPAARGRCSTIHSPRLARLAPPIDSLLRSPASRWVSLFLSGTCEQALTRTRAGTRVGRVPNRAGGRSGPKKVAFPLRRQKERRRLFTLQTQSDPQIPLQLGRGGAMPGTWRRERERRAVGGSGFPGSFSSELSEAPPSPSPFPPLDGEGAEGAAPRLPPKTPPKLRLRLERRRRRQVTSAGK